MISMIPPWPAVTLTLTLTLSLYARASHEQHAGASVALATAVEGRSLEEASRGYVQPRAWRRT